MSQFVPVLTEAVTRYWGLDDPRVLSCLRAENQPGRGLRTKAVGNRARDAGWPPETSTAHDARIAQTRAVRRLQRMDFSHRGQSRRNYRQRAAAAAYERRHRAEITVELDDHGDGPVSIFDE